MQKNVFWYQGYHSVLGELCRICILQTYHCGLCLPSVVNFLWWICAKVWTSINFVIFNCSHYFIWTNTVIHPFLDNIGEWNPSIQPFKWNLASFNWQTFLMFFLFLKILLIAGNLDFFGIFLALSTIRIRTINWK